MEPIHVDTLEIWPDAFAFFFLLAIATAVVGVYLYGQRRGTDPVRFNFYQLVAVGIGLATSKIYMMNAGQACSLLGGDGLPHATGMNLLGGVMGGALAVYLLRLAQRSRDPIFDAWAWLVPAAVLVGRVGCFSAGCCHGVVTHMPWGTTYPAPALPVQQQWLDGLLPLTRHVSLPVHPVPVYEFALVILLLLVLRRFAPRLQRSSAFLLSVGLYSLVRFTVEFVRYGGSTLGPLKTVQWGLLLCALGCAAALWRRERRSVAEAGPTRPAWVLQALLLALVVAACFWFDRLERASLMVAAAPWVGHVALTVGQRVARGLSPRIPAGISSGVALATLAAWSPLALQDERPETPGKRSLLVEFGGSSGQVVYQEACDDTRYQDKFFDVRLKLAHRWRYRTGSLVEVGAVGWGGVVSRLEGPQEGDDEQDFGWTTGLQGAIQAPYSVIGVQPYVLWDFYWGAIGGGFHVFGSPEADSMRIAPSAYTRWGPEDIAFAEGSVLWPGAPMGGSVFRFGLGTTLGPIGTLRGGLLMDVQPNLAMYLEPRFSFPVDGYILTLSPLLSLDFRGEFFQFGGLVGLESPLDPGERNTR